MAQQNWPHYTLIMGTYQDGKRAASLRYRFTTLAASKRYRWISPFAVASALLLWFLFIDHTSLPLSRQLLVASKVNADPGHHTDEMARVEWHRFAYTQYVTDDNYLCNSVMFFARLHEFKSKADRVMMYPFHMLQESDTESHRARLLRRARDEYNVKLVPIEVQRKTDSDPTWSASFTKLLAFNQTQYDRVLSIDSDSLLLQHCDELFMSPSCPVAMPRAYWMLPDNPVLSSQVVLIEPSTFEFARIEQEIEKAGAKDYDMEIVNHLYHDSAMLLPHRPYDLLTGEFRGKDHTKYLGNDQEKWDPVAVYNEAKLVHFSDWPLPKPWIESSAKDIEPTCDGEGDHPDCSARDIWRGIYSDFRALRKRVCDAV